MKKRWVLGVILLGLGVLTVVSPLSWFPPCSDDPEYAMPCLYSARAAAGLGGVTACGGVFYLLSAPAGIRRGIALTLIPVAVLIPLVMLWLVGICGMERMSCQLAMKPALCVLSGLTALAALAGAALPERTARDGESPDETA